MPYSRITGTRYGADAIKYARDGHGHDGSDNRNRFVSTVNMFSEQVMSYEKQMEVYWNKASAKCKNQVRRVVQSFSRKELNPDNPEDILKANLIGRLMAEQAYPGHQAVVFTQTDGEGGLIHNHIIVNNINMMTTKGCTDEQTKFWYVQRYTDKIAEDYITLDRTKQSANDKTTRTERQKRKEGKYVWKDDLKERVSEAMKEASDRNDFLKRLKANGVKGVFRTSKKYGDFILYELVDTSNFGKEKIPTNLKSKSYKMGTDYGVEKLDEMLQNPTLSKVINTTIHGLTNNGTDKKKDSPGLRPGVNQMYTKIDDNNKDARVILEEKSSILETDEPKKGVKPSTKSEENKVPVPQTSSSPEKSEKSNTTLSLQEIIALLQQRLDADEQQKREQEQKEQAQQKDIYFAELCESLAKEMNQKESYQDDDWKQDEVDFIEVPEEELPEEILEEPVEEIEIIEDNAEDTPQTAQDAVESNFDDKTKISSNLVGKRQETANTKPHKFTGMEEKRDNMSQHVEKKRKETGEERLRRMLQVQKRRDIFELDAADAYKQDDDFEF